MKVQCSIIKKTEGFSCRGDISGINYNNKKTQINIRTLLLLFFHLDILFIMIKNQIVGYKKAYFEKNKLSKNS